MLPKPILLPPSLVMIRSVKSPSGNKTDRVNKTDRINQRKENTSNEKQELTELILETIKNPLKMNVNAFISTRSSYDLRSRVNSQINLNKKRRQSIMENQQIIPLQSRSPNSRVSLYQMKVQEPLKKPQNLSKLSTPDLISYHKNLIASAQKLMLKTSKKK